MPEKTPEHLGKGLSEEASKFLLFRLPGLLRELGLDGLPGEKRSRLEWEFAVFLLYCGSRVCAAEIADKGRQEAVLASFFRNLAGGNRLRDFLTDVRPRVEEYDGAEAAELLHAKILPGEPGDPKRVGRLRNLYAKMSLSFRTVLEV